jgi:hypothetical protein
MLQKIERKEHSDRLARLREAIATRCFSRRLQIDSTAQNLSARHNVDQASEVVTQSRRLISEATRILASVHEALHGHG